MQSPYEFTGNYAFCYRNPRNCMDKRHVYTLFDILCSVPFKSALEVGCADGASSTAFVEAMKRTDDLRCTFVDPRITQSLIDVVDSQRDSTRALIVQGTSYDVLRSPETYGGPFDFVCLDGNHDYESVAAEIALVNRTNLLGIAGHDTSATVAGYPKAEGAELLKRTVMFDWGWYCIEDNQKREGEETQRGLFFGTPSREVYKRAVAAFRRHCFASQGETAHVG